MGKENESDYIPKYIKLDVVLKLMLDELNIEIDAKALNLVAKYFDTAVENAAAKLAEKFK